jgi:hypothetical protein
LLRDRIEIGVTGRRALVAPAAAANTRRDGECQHRAKRNERPETVSMEHMVASLSATFAVLVPVTVILVNLITSGKSRYACTHG